MSFAVIFISCQLVHSVSDHIDFKGTLNAVPELPYCVTEFEASGTFNLDNLEVCCLYSDVCIISILCVTIMINTL